MHIKCYIRLLYIMYMYLLLLQMLLEQVLQFIAITLKYFFLYYLVHTGNTLPKR